MLLLLDDESSYRYRYRYSYCCGYFYSYGDDFVEYRPYYSILLPIKSMAVLDGVHIRIFM